MTIEFLTHLSHQFCINCCGEHKKFDCDTRNTTCDKLASFLVGCHKFQEPIDEEKLDKLAETYANKMTTDYDYYNDWSPLNEGFKDGYRKALGYE